jgi:hypothetical protein
MGLFYSCTTYVIGLSRGYGCIKRELYHRLWMYEKRPIPEVVDEKRDL